MNASSTEDCISSCCLRPDGSGYITVPGAWHSFYSNCEGGDGTQMKCVYRDSHAPWGLTAATDWLAATAAPATKSRVVAASREWIVANHSCDRAIDTPLNYDPECVGIGDFFLFLPYTPWIQAWRSMAALCGLPATTYGALTLVAL
eukprot:7039181-Prymnesium_polylepis.1